MFKKYLIGLTLCCSLVFGTVQLGDGGSTLPGFMLTNLTTVQDLRSGMTTGLYGWTLLNSTGNSCFVEFFDSTAANVVLGVTSPIFIIPIEQHNMNNLFLTLPVRGFDPSIQNHNLSVAAVLSPGGSTPCGMGVSGSIIITNN